MQADAAAAGSEIVGCWQANNAIYRLDNLAALTAEQALNGSKVDKRDSQKN
tara:strand:- start:268 stop:420 length:153 start_codon:yes stop_codon:yes gene_type:complete